MSHTAITLCVASILLFVCPSMIVSYPFMQNALRKRRNTDSGTDDIHQSWDSLRNSIGTVLNGDMLLDTFEAAHFPHPHHLSMPFEFDEHSLFDLPDRAPNAHISPLDKPSSNPAGVEFYSTSASTSHTSIETPAGRKSYSDEMSNVTYKPATSDEASSVTKAAQELDINGDVKGAVGLNVAAIPVDTDREGQSVTVVNTYQSAPGAVNDDIIALDTQVIDTDVTPTDIESNGSSSSSSTDAITESVADMPVDISTPAASEAAMEREPTRFDTKKHFIVSPPDVTFESVPPISPASLMLKNNDVADALPMEVGSIVPLPVPEQQITIIDGPRYDTPVLTANQNLGQHQDQQQQQQQQEEVDAAALNTKATPASPSLSGTDETRPLNLSPFQRYFLKHPTMIIVLCVLASILVIGIFYSVSLKCQRRSASNDWSPYGSLNTILDAHKSPAGSSKTVTFT